MSLIKKADVENHFAGRRRKNPFPFGPTSRPNAIGHSGDGSREAKVNEAKSRQGHDREHSSVKPSVAATESHVDPARSAYTSAARKLQS
jgi:hypothetical protein